MFKKFFNILISVLIITISGVIVYYFYLSNIDSSITLSDTFKVVFSNFDISNKSKALTNLNTISDFSTNTNNTGHYYYYYDQLDDNAKIIYNALENNIDNLKTYNFKIDFSTYFNTLLNQVNGKSLLDTSFQSALDAFLYDHPELFYLDLTKINLVIKYAKFGTKTTYTVSISPGNTINYLSDNFTSESQVETAIKQVKTLRNNIINNLTGSDYNKVLIVHDTLVDLLEYNANSNNSNTYTIYGALVENKVVCEGYAKTFKYIMDSLNIPCILVSGTATNNSGKSEPHMWNYVELNGNWYGVDVTWDDPIIIGGSKKASNVKRNYFCKGYYSFVKTHIADGKISENGKCFSIPTLSKSNYK